MEHLRYLLAGVLLASTVVLLLCSTGSGADPRGPSATFSTRPSIVPAFRSDQTDYAVRCRDGKVRYSFNLPRGWSGRVGNRSFGSGARTIELPMRQNRQLVVSLRKPGAKGETKYHVRCLPNDFGPFKVTSAGAGGPRLTMVQLVNGYAAAFDSRGAPVWWYQAKSGSPDQSGMNAEDAQFLADGTFSYAPINGYFGKQFQVRTLEGRLVRTLVAANGLNTDLHDLQLLSNGNYLLGAHRIVDDVNTKRFGGPARASIDTAQIQELRPNGRLVWKWDAYPRIGLAESGQWWKQFTGPGFGEPFDVNHWNSVAIRGKYMLLSFRHLDAVYKVNRRTGRIVWKLGGTKTGNRLRLRGDRYGRYPFGGQHDARFAPGNSVTVFDNFTNFNGKPARPARAVRYRIDPNRKSARLIEQINDPTLTNSSIGFGSARLLNSGNWLVDWGATSRNQLIGAYRPNGKPVLRIRTPNNLSYRAIPADGPRPTIRRLRKAMDRMSART